MSARLYTVVNRAVDDDMAFYDSEFEPMECPRPVEWEAFCIERYGVVKPFFLPAAGRIYKSRSGAVERAELINYWGGDAEVLECTPVWESLDDARRGRERRKIEARMVKLQDQYSAEVSKLGRVAS